MIRAFALPAPHRTCTRGRPRAVRGAAPASVRAALRIALCAALLALCFAPGGLRAQTLILTNYNRHPVGELAGMQGGAVTARVSDPSAPWYNPAGLAGVSGSTVSANATIYEASRFDVGGGPLFLNTTSSANLLGYTLGPAAEVASAAGGSTPAAGGSAPTPASAAWGIAFATPVDFSSAAAVTSANGQAGVLNPDGSVTMVPAATSQDSSAAITLLTASVGRGWQSAPDLRLGVALEAGLLTLSARQNSSARQPFQPGDAGFPHVELEQESFFHGSENVLRAAAGLQVRLAPAWLLGVTVKTASLNLSNSASLRKQALEARDLSADNINPPATERRTQSTFFADYHARFNYVIPPEARVGLAWVQPALEWELDVLYYAAVQPYAFFTSSAQATDTVIGTSAQSSSSSDRFSREENSARSVVNLALGGRMRLSENGWWNVGLYTDRSPHNTASVISGAMDLLGFSTGYALLRGSSSTAVGVVVLRGSTNNLKITNFFDNSLQDEFGPATLTSVAAFVSGSLRF